MNRNENRAYNEPQGTGVPQHPIPSALSQLSAAVHEMGLQADNLAARLGVVLMPAPPAIESKDRALAAAAPVTSQTTDEILGLRRRVDNIRDQLQDVLNRLEV